MSVCPPQVTNNATKSANRGKKRKKPAAASATSAAAAAADDEGGDESGSSSSASAAAVIMQSDAVRVPGLSHDLQQQITKFDSSEFDVSHDGERKKPQVGGC